MSLFTKSNPPASPVEEVADFLHHTHSGTFCTLSSQSDTQGWPFGSVVPYALDDNGCPLLLLAGIAAHTKNVKTDSRASLLIQERRDDDPQAGWRVTVMGHASKIDEQEATSLGLHERYQRVVPAAIQYRETHDFYLWRISVEKVRYIGGFGKIYWLDGDAVMQAYRTRYGA